MGSILFTAQPSRNKESQHQIPIEGLIGCAWLAAALPLSERHAGLEQVFPNLLLAIDRALGKLFRLSNILFLQI
jgi:hypothetical protein